MNDEERELWEQMNREDEEYQAMQDRLEQEFDEWYRENYGKLSFKYLEENKDIVKLWAKMEYDKFRQEGD